MPTTAAAQYSGIRLEPYMDPEDALMMAVQLAASVTYPKGTILGEVTATPGVFKAYASGSVDGSQIPKAILVYPTVTDGSGNATIAGEYGATRKDVPVYFAGTFATADLVGLDAAALTNKPSWNLVQGSTSAGILRLP